MVAWHQGQHAGCSTASAPVPKKPWQWCGVSGASLGAITFQRENKLTTYVHCTSLIFAGRKEKGRCRRSWANDRWMLIAVSACRDALIKNDRLGSVVLLKQALLHSIACLPSTAIKVHAFSKLLTLSTRMHRHEKWHANMEAPQGLSCDSPNQHHSIRWPLMLCCLAWIKSHCCCH